MAAAPQPAPPEAPGGVYVYGVVRAGHPVPPGRTGVGGLPGAVRTLPAGELAAVVSDAPDRLRAKRRDLLAHQDLALALAADGPVLPMRFGMVAPDEESVRRQLESSQGDCLTALRRVEGRVEMNVKVSPAQGDLESLVREDPEVGRARAAARGAPGYEASVRLGEAVARGLTRRAAAVAAGVVAELSALAEARVAGPEVPGCVLNASFLLPRSATGRFGGAVERLAARYGARVELRLTGPLPCYSFVEGAWGS
ncbi:GvpL/GvpF family gas vesicle protein [Streptomyces sp. NA02950]|uniref:GvpL/GvpF family gas vesicle protein n=1 Tax=Streptomyces sp. NA02950 TaxID=2742137 RepID=UPI0015903666|nr:GvpL/GvpF family gas vesicle protein [Streptomyces sp. NA02950]QKV92882.1 GvpL/GvpF family gas vesicle protein [Streptomyces sp. NA02950]